nr:hypothetical protein [Tanacetum cinerariifolium]
FEEIEAKFAEVWKQVEDFIPIGSKEENERLKRKGLNLEKEQVKCSHWQYKFPLPVKVVATARRLEMRLLKVCTAIEEKKKKLPVKDRWQLH